MTATIKAAYITKGCVACGCCAKTCPIRAISIYKGLYAKPDENKCVGCGQCAKACPANVIEVKVREVAAV